MIVIDFANELVSFFVTILLMQFKIKVVFLVLYAVVGNKVNEFVFELVDGGCEEIKKFNCNFDNSGVL